MVQFGGTQGGGRLAPRETWEYGLPHLRIAEIALQPDGTIDIRWTGGAPLYQLQRRSSLSAGEWQDVNEPTDQLDATVQPEGAAGFFRVLGLSGNAP